MNTQTPQRRNSESGEFSPGPFLSDDSLAADSPSSAKTQPMDLPVDRILLYRHEGQSAEFFTENFEAVVQREVMEDLLSLVTELDEDEW
eukprot:CAMPEP_0177640646 /NCGR_PEP_ID=MMETSP0447-20121125/6652_1 /TAXON_ID=0 /ORGANISM="Stygamoeba regulata, Strain BSH-02190019" /LENGTH=88 /DNA_ID=CAMNT_0019142727 /DNA_START=71 /DNA_END=334 /DNA_ORIENTATION=+